MTLWYTKFMGFKVFFLVFLVSCQTSTLSYRYKNSLKNLPDIPNSEKLSIVILVDGLSHGTLEKALRENAIPHIQNFFSEIHQIRNAFPSLTFPNITSLLTTSPISNHLIVGNKMKYNNFLYNFEHENHAEIHNDLVKPLSIFTRLEKNREASISFSYYFKMGASVTADTNIDTGLAYNQGQYHRLDSHEIDETVSFLESTPSEEWPRIIFLHLVGVDGESHENGPLSHETIKYFSYLDEKLDSLFRIYSKINAQKNTSLMLLADHGFIPIENQINIEKFKDAFEHQFDIFNEGRILVFYNKEKSGNDLLMHQLLDTLPVRYLFKKELKGYSLFNKKYRYEIQAKPSNLCPIYPYRISVSQYKKVKHRYVFLKRKRGCAYLFEDYFDVDKYLIPLATDFMLAKTSPDYALTASRGFSFLKERGSHGGSTSDELLSPMLTKNLVVRKKIMGIEEVLKFLFD